MLGGGVRHPVDRESAAGDHLDHDRDNGVGRRTHEHVLRLALSGIEDRTCHLLHNIACTTSI